ncbi:MAG: transketolase C-terminal domain-containing protein [Candidatus Verstraetearchaeota archaeon]|nr:transketolase C-terminal domain-containing protein [Candidatus Verstraetearchaeota archaeon]
MNLIATGNHAVAYGVKAARAEVIAAYPITPQTQIIEKLSEFIERGEMGAKFMRVESEHSAMAACIGASACGARTFTATSSQGLLYMSEMVFWAGLGSFPVVMAVVTRTLAPPWSIWNEHTDMLSQRDAGWIMMMCDSVQEAYDASIQAFRIAEDRRVRQPVMFGLDAFSLSHTSERLDPIGQEEADAFLPSPDGQWKVIDVQEPATYGNLVGPERMMEIRHSIMERVKESAKVIEEAASDFGRVSGRKQAGLVEEYRTSGAEVILVVAGASSGDAMDAADALRDEGVKAGVARLRVLRPFPSERLRETLKGCRAVAVMDRDYSFGSGGIIGHEVASATGVRPFNYIAGIGGRDLSVNDFAGIASDALRRAEAGNEGGEIWWGMKGYQEHLP